MKAGVSSRAVSSVLLLLVPVSLGLLLWNVVHLLPLGTVPGALNGDDGFAAVLLRESLLPRLAVSLLAGASLGLSGLLMQLVMRNPLAEPTTLGTSAGAQLGLALAGLYAPALFHAAPGLVALAGGVMATLLVLALGWPRLSPPVVILAGLFVSLFCGSAASVLALFHRESLQSLFIWNSGSLIQDGWGVARHLLWHLVIAAVMTAMLGRVLAMTVLDERNMRGLGLSPRKVAALCLSVAVGLSALVTSAVGVIGFVGLAAPALATLAGARRLAPRLFLSPLVGALLLCVTDEAVQALSPVLPDLPTGIATAFLGAPLLLWMMRRLPALPAGIDGHATAVVRRLDRPGRVLLLLGVLGLACALLALLIGHRSEDALLLHWRWPRVLAALAGGAMLAAAGSLMQTMTANPMASPEGLGISSGAALGAVGLLLFVPGSGPGLETLAASAGAAACLLLILLLGRRDGFAGDRLLLAGISLATVFGAMASLLMASGDPRAPALLSWMAGSTYRVSPLGAVIAGLVGSCCILLAPLLRRFLLIVPLGDATGRALGLDMGAVRLLLLLAIAVLTATATMVVGPLSFVGLMAPHMARLCGLQTPLPRLAGAALFGALVMVLSDWIGRTVLFPYQIPAGLVATAVGAPVFMFLLRRTHA